jgi:hypothetical protein
MGLAQRGLLWVVVVALVSVLAALGLGGARVAKLHGDAAAVRVELVLAAMRAQLDGSAASARTLALVADGVIPTHGGGMMVAVLDPAGLVVAASTSGLVGGRAPRAWLDGTGAVRSGGWSAGGLGGHAAAAPVTDLNGRMIGIIVVEDPATPLPLIARVLQPAAVWGLALLLVLVPACWFAAQLAMGRLGRTAAAAAALLATLRKDGTAPPEMLAEAGSDFADLGATAETVLTSYARAVDAVSDAGAAPVRAGTTA